MIKSLAFLQRATGLQKRYRPFENIQDRARELSQKLDHPRESLAHRVATAQLAYYWDVLSEEAAVQPEALRVQVRLIDSRHTIPAAEKIFREQFSKAPMGRLAGAILAQAFKDGASEIEIDFGSAQGQIQVRFLIHSRWIEAMTVPQSLSTSLRGIFLVIEAATYPKVRPLMPSEMALPEGVTFSGTDSDRLLIGLVS